MNLLLTFLLLAFTATAFGSPQSERLQKARAAISAGNDREAKADLEWLVSKNRRTPEGEEASVLLIESGLRQKKWKQAETELERFLIYHTKSPYRSRVEWAQARLMLQNGELLGASKKMAELLSRPLSPTLRNEIRTQLQLLLQSGLMGQLELETLLKAGVADTLLTGELLYQLAQVFEKEQRWRGAAHFCGWLQDQFPDHPRAQQAGEQLQKLQTKGAGKPIIVLVAPLTGDYAQFGADLLQGSLLALEQGGGEQAIGWRAVDSRAQPSDALIALQQIVAQENVLAVVGPVLSPVASALAAWMAIAIPHIPLVVPVASAEGIAEIGSNIFQLTPPTSEQARAVARHAINCYGHREFAVLAPRTSYGENLATAFVDEVERSGGTILGIENYTEGLPDYKSHFETLRLKGYKLLRERRAIAVGATDLTDRAGAKARNSYLADSLITVDGLFIAASTPDDAVQMAGQTRFNKINGQFLGTSGWYGAGLLRGGRKIVDGALIASDFLERSDDPTWSSFSKAYQKRWAAQPGQDRVAGLSYDAVRYILHGEKKRGDRSLVSAMRSVGKIPGVYGEIVLNNKNGSNQNTHLVSVEGGVFKTIDGCPAQ